MMKIQIRICFLLLFANNKYFSNVYGTRDGLNFVKIGRDVKYATMSYPRLWILMEQMEFVEPNQSIKSSLVWRGLKELLVESPGLK